MTPPYKGDETPDHDAKPRSLRLEGQFRYGNGWGVYRHGFIGDVGVPVPVVDWKAAGAIVIFREWFRSLGYVEKGVVWASVVES